MDLVHYLRKNGVERLKKDYFITATQCKSIPSLWLFKYSQLNSPFHKPVVRQCRGTILDQANNWSLVAYPYEKFFNYGESNAAKIDWKSEVKVYEKTDGSLMMLYYYQGSWRVSTSGIPDASGRIFINKRKQKEAQPGGEEDGAEDGEEEDGEGEVDAATAEDNQVITYADYFWQVFKEKGYSLPDEKDIDKCFMFELASTVNRVIVVYEKEKLYIHGMRNMVTLKEEDPVSYAKKYNWNVSPSFTFKSLEEVVAASLKLNPIKEEGYVICDAHFNRIKVKCPAYVTLSLLSVKDKDKLNAVRLLSILQQNETEEFLTYFPFYKTQFEEVRKRYLDFLKYAVDLWGTVADVQDAKQFALKMNSYPKNLVGAFFQMRKDPNASLKDYFSNMPSKKLYIFIQDYEKSLKQE